jgi:hypothetical protein
MITLQNEGLIEIDAIKTMGVHVKDGESIGFFGTGLKYAIAVFLREGVDFSLYIGSNLYDFFTIDKQVRGKTFQFCHMQGPYDSTELGFTTEVGKNWDLWQAYREVHSNCLDELGSIYTGNNFHPHAKDGYTTFRFQDLDEKINVSEIFLSHRDKVKNDLNLLYSNDDIEIYEGESDYLYYNGIRAKDLDKKSLYTYNVKAPCSLTEDRLLCYDFEIRYILNSAVANMVTSNRDVMKNIVTSVSGTFESTLDINNYYSGPPPEEFVEELIKVKGEAELNYSVDKYVQRHSPKPELTPQEKKSLFLVKLKELCEENEVEMIKGSFLGNDTIELRQGILNVEEEGDE